MLKWLFAVVAIFIVIGVVIGFAADWQGLGLLERGDRLWPGPAGIMVAQDVRYGHDDPIQAVDVYAPRNGRPGDHRPVIVWIHGGGWVKGSRPFYGFAGRAYAAQGFVVIVAGYRLGAAGHWPRFMQDGAAAVRWAQANVARYGGDPANIFIAGHSAGAHIAALLALDPRWLGDMVRPGGGVTGAIGLSGPYDFLPMEPGGRGDAAMGDVVPLTSTQPVSFVRADAPALFLGTGDADTTVRPRNARALDLAERTAGGTVDLRVWHGLGHEDVVKALSLPFRTVAPVLAQSSDFVRRMSAARVAVHGATAAPAAIGAPPLPK